MGKLINQEENYNASFGAVFRSSAIFYRPKDVQTTISFSDYWQFKNNIKVGLVVSIRDMSGSLISRKEVGFTDGNVLNIEVSEVDEGSIEIEAFSSVNLRIPYAAIMVVYETQSGVSMVHSYGRNHSLIELEDGKAITEARESCWTLRTNQNVSNQAVFHNGHIPLMAQEGILLVTKEDGAEKKITFNIPPLKAFETYVFDVEKIFPQVHHFLESKIGWGTLHFESRSSFTRLLIIWRNKATKEIQVTHSNFDYSSHSTNLIEATKPAYMVLPNMYGSLPNVIVYPKHSKGNYLVNGTKKFRDGIIIESEGNELSFIRRDGELPSRIVTAATGSSSEDVSLPFECSLGVVHEKRPLKRFHWFLISSVMPSVIHLTSYEKIYPSFEPVELIVRLYSDSTKDIDEVVLRYESLANVLKEIKVEEIFDLRNVRKFGYISIFSNYGGFFIYSSLKKNNALTLEHTF